MRMTDCCPTILRQVSWRFGHDRNWDWSGGTFNGSARTPYGIGIRVQICWTNMPSSFDSALSWKMVADGQSGRVTEAFQAFWVLLRCYPAGLVDLFKGKASKSFIFWKQRSS
jgi:hypothetical protein